MDLGRDEAIMVLAYSIADADGVTSAVEEQAIEERMRERGLQVPSLRSMELRRVAQNDRDISSELLQHVAKALPDPVDRLEAIRLAIDVVWSDARIEPAEMVQIMEMADELGLDRSKISRSMHRDA